MTTLSLQQIMTQAMQLSPPEQALLMERLAAALRQRLSESSNASDIPEWTDAERMQMLLPEPLPPAEVVARGLTGTWTNVADGAEWVNEQKRQREIKRQWKFQQP